MPHLPNKNYEILFIDLIYFLFLFIFAAVDRRCSDLYGNSSSKLINTYFTNFLVKTGLVAWLKRLALWQKKIHTNLSENGLNAFFCDGKLDVFHTTVA